MQELRAGRKHSIDTPDHGARRSTKSRSQENCLIGTTANTCVCQSRLLHPGLATQKRMQCAARTSIHCRRVDAQHVSTSLKQAQQARVATGRLHVRFDKSYRRHSTPVATSTPWSQFSDCLIADHMDITKPILSMESARMYTKLRAVASTTPRSVPRKKPRVDGPAAGHELAHVLEGLLQRRSSPQRRCRPHL